MSLFVRLTKIITNEYGTLCARDTRSLKTTACPKPYTSYRASFDAPNGKWETVRIPFLNFRGKGDGIEDTTLDTSALTRVGIVAIGRPMKVKLAVGGFRFY